MPPRYQPSPDTEYPLMYRIAQFLLGSSDAVGEFGQGMRQQSSDASDILDTQERQRLAQDEMDRRNRATDLDEWKFKLDYLKPKAPSLYSHDPTKDLYEGTTLKQRGQPAPAKPQEFTAERTAALAASALRKKQQGFPTTPEEDDALDTYSLKANTGIDTAAIHGSVGASAGLQQAGAAPPVFKPRLGDQSAPGPALKADGLDRNPDFREGGGLSVPKGGSVAQAAERDLFSGKAPFPATPAPSGQTVLGRKTQIEEQTKLDVKQGARVGDAAQSYVLKSTGLPPPPDMPLEQVQREGVAVTPQQINALNAFRRGLSQIKEIETQKAERLFPEAPFKGKGIGAALGNFGRAKAFGIEAYIRSASEPEYADLMTWFATARPALAKATGEVGNLSQMEQDVVKEGIGITRTREAFASGIATYRRILEKGFAANGIPVPAELRGSGAGAAAPGAASGVDAEVDAFLRKKGMK